MAEEKTVIEYFIGLLGQVKVFHWATTSLAVHKALDELHASLSDSIDTLVEAYIGRTKKQPLRKFVIATSSTTDASKVEKYLETESDKLLKMSAEWTKYPELQNILQEMIASVNKALYVCRLK